MVWEMCGVVFWGRLPYFREVWEHRVQEGEGEEEGFGNGSRVVRCAIYLIPK
jgi:hypothetical protein